MTVKQQTDQFTITNQSERQIKIIVPSLFCNKERATILQTVLLMRDAIEEVKIDIKKNSVLIDFNPDILQKENLLDLIETVLKNFYQKPKNNLKNNEIEHFQQGDKEQAITFKVKGMSCNSCALFLEMVLIRNPEIMQAKINYTLETGVVKGFLNQEEIIQIIENNGFQASSLNTVS